MSILYLKYVESSIPVVFHGVLCVIAYLFWASLALVTLPILAIYKFFKVIQVALICHKMRNVGTVFSMFDIPYLYDSEENPNFINALVTLKGKPYISELRSLVLSKFVHGSQAEVTYRRMRQKVSQCYNTYVWKDEDDFKIEQHVLVYDGKPPSSKRELEKLFSSLCSDSLSCSEISPWQFIIVPLNLEAKESMYCLYFKVHHCIGDGFALVGLLAQLVDQRPKFIEPKKEHGVMAYPVERVLKGIITGPLALLTLMFSRYVRNPFMPKAPPIKKAVSWTRPLDVEAVRSIKNKTDSTVNDVLTSCVAGAIRRYLQENGVDHPEDQPITMTYNSRSISTKLREYIPLGNRSGATFLLLPISIGDPLRRLQVTKARIDKIKKSSDPHLFSFIYMYVLGNLPDPITRLSIRAVNKHCSLVLSNVPGPIDPLYIAGQSVESIMVIPPLAFDLGLSMAIFSYAGDVRLTVQADKAVIKSPEKLTRAFEQEFELLSERVLLQD